MHPNDSKTSSPDETTDTDSRTPAETDDVADPGEETEGSVDVTEQDADVANEIDVSTIGDDGLSDLHTSLVAAPSITLKASAAQVGEQWVKTLVVVDYPDVAVPGMLDRALTKLPGIDLDYSIHLRPRDPTQTIGKLKKSIRDLKVKQAEKAGRGDVTQIDTERTLEDHKAIYTQLVDGSQRIFDVNVTLTVRGDEKEEVEQAAERLSRNLQSSQLTAKSATCRQDDALVCTSPIGKNVLQQTGTMLGGAVGCLYPFSSGTIIEEDGVLMGYHSVTGSPVVVNRFAREKGYNCFIAGNIGAGKTFNTLLTLLRTYAKDEDTLVIVADPFGDLAVLTEILNGEQVVMSGKRGLNPLEISPTPEAVLDANPDLDPYTKTVQKDVMEFLQAFFDLEEMSLTGKRGVLSVALKAAYRWKGITPDPATHHNESPTLRDVQNVLTDMTKNPARYIGDESEAIPDIEVELWRKRASQLRMDLAPFREGGEYANLACQTEIDLTGTDVLYLDMQQIEGKQKTGLMLQMVLRAVYERAKQTDQKVIFAVDEAHYLMQNEASLSFLERATRHARHYDLSLQLITQTVDEFFSRADEDEMAQKAKAIADNCALKIFHHVEGLTDENAEKWLDLSPPEAKFIRTAKPGSEEYGYSQALVEVGEAGRFPINVHALPEEEALITQTTAERDVEVDTDSVSEVGGADCVNPSQKQDQKQRDVLSEETSPVDIATFLNDIDPLKLRESLDKEGLENLDHQPGSNSNE